MGFRNSSGNEVDLRRRRGPRPDRDRHRPVGRPRRPHHERRHRRRRRGQRCERFAEIPRRLVHPGCRCEPRLRAASSTTAQEFTLWYGNDPAHDDHRKARPDRRGDHPCRNGVRRAAHRRDRGVLHARWRREVDVLLRRRPRSRVPTSLETAVRIAGHHAVPLRDRHRRPRHGPVGAALRRGCGQERRSDDGCRHHGRAPSTADDPGFTVVGATATVTNPTPGASVDINVINGRAWITVTFTNPTLFTIDPASITDLAAEFQLSGPGLGTIQVDGTQAPQLMSSTADHGRPIRYWLTGRFATTGAVNLTFLAGQLVVPVHPHAAHSRSRTTPGPRPAAGSIGRALPGGRAARPAGRLHGRPRLGDRPALAGLLVLGGTGLGRRARHDGRDHGHRDSRRVPHPGDGHHGRHRPGHRDAEQRDARVPRRGHRRLAARQTRSRSPRPRTSMSTSRAPTAHGSSSTSPRSSTSRAEFELFGEGLGSILLDAARAPLQLTAGVPAGMLRFRFWLIGEFDAGHTVTLSPLARSWSYLERDAADGIPRAGVRRRRDAPDEHHRHLPGRRGRRARGRPRDAAPPSFVSGLSFTAAAAGLDRSSATPRGRSRRARHRTFRHPGRHRPRDHGRTSASTVDDRRRPGELRGPSTRRAGVRSAPFTADPRNYIDVPFTAPTGLRINPAITDLGCTNSPSPSPAAHRVTIGGAAARADRRSTA